MIYSRPLALQSLLDASRGQLRRDRHDDFLERETRLLGRTRERLEGVRELGFLVVSLGLLGVFLGFAFDLFTSHFHRDLAGLQISENFLVVEDFLHLRELGLGALVGDAASLHQRSDDTRLVHLILLDVFHESDELLFRHRYRRVILFDGNDQFRQLLRLDLLADLEFGCHSGRGTGSRFHRRAGSDALGEGLLGRKRSSSDSGFSEGFLKHMFSVFGFWFDLQGCKVQHTEVAGLLYRSRL